MANIGLSWRNASMRMARLMLPLYIIELLNYQEQYKIIVVELSIPPQNRLDIAVRVQPL
jgi:hypothetical protein